MFKTLLIPKLMIPVAAFAVMVTSASAFAGSDMMSKLNLTDSQKSALEQAKTIRTDAAAQAKKVLTDAGIDEAKMKEIHTAVHDARVAERKAVVATLDAKDYAAFQAAASGTPLASKITTQDQFNQLVKAHDLMKSGDRAGAKVIFDQLDIHPLTHDGFRGGMMGGRGMHMGAQTTAL
jgi:hypothetical protein